MLALADRLDDFLCRTYSRRQRRGCGLRQKNFSHSIFYPDRLGVNSKSCFAYTPAAEIYEDLATFMGAELSARSRRRLQRRMAGSRPVLDELRQCDENLVGGGLPGEQQSFIAYHPPRPASLSLILDQCRNQVIARLPGTGHRLVEFGNPASEFFVRLVFYLLRQYPLRGSFDLTSCVHPR